MSTHSDAGIAKKVANMDKLVAKLLELGATYQPANPLLAITHLQARYALGVQWLDTSRDDKVAGKTAIANRQLAFKPSRNKSSRLYYHLVSLGVSAKDLQMAQSINRKLSGRRAGGKGGDAPKPVEGAEQGNASGNGHSVSQLSFDNIIAHWEEWKILLEKIPGYATNEAEFTIAGITAYIQLLKDTNTAVITAEAKEANSRNRRDEVIITDAESIINLGNMAKNYIKSILKPNNPIYKQIMNISF